MLISVVIATRNRPDPLRATLGTLAKQTKPPLEVIVVDSSPDGRTAEVVRDCSADSGLDLRYFHVAQPSAAGQRNLGVDQSQGEIVVFVDDDVDLCPAFLDEVTAPIRNDTTNRVAGVSGRITNQGYSQPSGLNWLLLAICLGNFRQSWAGQLVGPAVNFLPDGQAPETHRVEWLFTTGTAYRKDVFQQYRFGSNFTGYSFAEDVHLSARIGRDWILLNAPKAYFYHFDMGGQTHTDWAALGESMVVNRHAIMTEVLGRSGLGAECRLAAYELIYGSLAWLASQGLAHQQRFRALFSGKLRGFWQLWIADRGPGARTAKA